MDGHQYEYECAKILRKKGFSNVQVTKGSGDQGIDIIAYGGGKKYGIQCKYYMSPVGNHAVQEAFSGAKYYDCDIAVVMTNNTFTPAAEELANRTGILLWENNKVLQSANSFWFTRLLENAFCALFWSLCFGCLFYLYLCVFANHYITYLAYSLMYLSLLFLHFQQVQ